MPQDKPPPPLHPTTRSSVTPARELFINVNADQSNLDTQEFIESPDTEFPNIVTAQGITFASPAATTNTSRSSSRDNSIHESSGATSDSGESVSSLGGLNHVNDGVGGSTAQRRMSRVYEAPPRRPSTSGRRQSTTLNQQQHENGYAPPLYPRRQSTARTIVDDTIVIEEKESCWKAWLRRYIPAYGWLISPGYNLAVLPDDLIAGVTISTVVIPQSMAYAMLAPLPPVYGLYTSVVPILIYCIFGTSRHMHTGTFAITTLLLGQAVRGLMAKQDPSSNINDLATTIYNPQSLHSSYTLNEPNTDDPEYEKRFIGMILMLSFVVGCVQVIMSFLRVGGWASKHLLPDALVGGFNTAAVFHIGTSQLKHFLGIKSVPSSQGAFALIKTWIWFGQNFWSETNWYTVGFGTIAILFMIVMRKIERKRKSEHELVLKKKELFMVQQRQAVSAAIIRDHEAQRAHQRQQQTKHNGNAEGAALSPYSQSPIAEAMSSDISLNTVGANDTHISPRDVERAVPTPRDDNIMMEAAQARQVYIPIPDILLAVIIMTIINVIFSLDTPRSEGGWGIDVIGAIPKGLPDIIFPANLITSGPKEWLTLDFLIETILPMIQPALLIAVIIYVMSFSIAKQFGKRYGYKVDPNQEMLALGLASMGGSIFSGYACTGSLTRTAILSQSGGVTPLASMVGVATVTLTLICLTWCFERVPNAVLAAIVLVALQSLVMQITEPLKLWRLGQRKASLIWSVTFIGVFVISVELGIAVGISVVLLTTAYSWFVNFRNEDDEPLLARDASGLGQRRSSTRSLSHDSHRRQNSTGSLGDATGSLLNHASANEQQRRRPSANHGRHLSGSLSPVSRGMDWKTRMLRTKWGKKIGSVFGMEQPMFSDSRHNNTEDEDY